LDFALWKKIKVSKPIIKSDDGNAVRAKGKKNLLQSKVINKIVVGSFSKYEEKETEMMRWNSLCNFIIFVIESFIKFMFCIA
jgi:hypothetical protein